MKNNFSEIIKKTEKEIKNLFASESSGHDFYHLKRVYNLAIQLQKKEGGDKLVVALSALLHDIHRIIEKETKKYCLPEDSFPKIKIILEKIGIEKEKTDKILYCIKVHEEYDFTEKGKSAKSIEALIVQDADNLDAIGAVGIARAFSFGGANGVPIYVPNIPFRRKIYNEVKKDPSEIHHFYSKLLKLKDNMNTKTAKKMADGRHKFLQLFLKEFFAEWQGIK